MNRWRAFCALALSVASACARAEERPPATPQPTPQATPSAGWDDRPTVAQPTIERTFNAERAYKQLADLTQRGQRYYGAPGRPQAITHLMDELQRVTHKVSRHDFDVTEPVSGETYTLTNITGSLWPNLQPRIILASHWDTRLWAEQDPDPARRDQPIPGANDGTSGVAVVMELARALHGMDGAPGIGVDVVLFDGEEFGRPGRGGYCKGSEAFADDIRATYPDALPIGGIVLDMVCDRDLTFKREPYSQQTAGPLADLVWSHGAKARPDVFLDDLWPAINDDHRPLQLAGVPSILIIDFDYPAWHTHADTIDKCDVASLKATGDALLSAFLEMEMRTFTQPDSPVLGPRSRPSAP